MKLKQNITIEQVKALGFMLIKSKADLPFEKMCKENPAFENITKEDIERLIAEDAGISRLCYIVDPRSEDHHQYNIGKYLRSIGDSRRGQYFYLILDFETKDIVMGATKPDGDGCDISIDNIFFELIESGLVER